MKDERAEPPLQPSVCEGRVHPRGREVHLDVQSFYDREVHMVIHRLAVRHMAVHIA